MKHDDMPTGAVLTKDESRILSWSYDRTLRLWDVAIGQQIGPAMKHDDLVTGAILTRTRAAFSPGPTIGLFACGTSRPAIRSGPP